MTVHELRERLADMDGSLPVVVEVPMLSQEESTDCYVDDVREAPGVAAYIETVAP